MNTFVAALLAFSISLFSSLACAQVNDRPITQNPPGSELVKDCEVTVRFNEDEASVEESEYLSSFHCLGIVEGIMSTNRIVRDRSPEHALFCIPPEGFKNWLAAKVIVEFAKVRPDALELDQTEFAVLALSDRFPCSSASASPSADVV